ncbi:hypothetical protein [Photorhabdus hindustanensis]|uniref:Uncharacterized protein n=1 Tax=Photorhabdus hindustanensis TaxID=2918802 RepID=A0A2S8Q3G1_9GAMM|nr:hypothetical protein [Photorhabdus hindustanensis]PQQ26562.1 hypothetical protein C6H66_10115 [Photorhabdus hindustanensis]
MKKFISMFFIFIGMISTSAFSAQSNSGIVRVYELKADWKIETNNPSLYLYTFKGNLAGNCGKPGFLWSKSSDENINNLLRSAYTQRLDIKVGIENANCIITTVEIVLN